MFSKTNFLRSKSICFTLILVVFFSNTFLTVPAYASELNSTSDIVYECETEDITDAEEAFESVTMTEAASESEDITKAETEEMTETEDMTEAASESEKMTEAEDMTETASESEDVTEAETEEMTEAEDISESEIQTESATFYILHKNTERPKVRKNTFNNIFFSKIGSGTITLPSEDVNIYESENTDIVTAPDCSRYLSDSEYINWYAICNTNGKWQVAGEICSNNNETNQMDTVTYYLLNPGVKKPESQNGLLWSNYKRIGYGKISHTEAPVFNSEDIASMIAEAPDCSKYLAEGESVEWYVIRECDDYTAWRIDGVIIPKDSKDFIRACGTEIVDSEGNPFQIKGIGMGNNVWYNQNSLPTTDHDEESFAELEELGFNSVRFYLNASLFESDSSPYTYSESALNWLDENIEWAKKHNIRLLLNMHIPQGGRVTSTNTKFWDDIEYQKRFIALWKELAQRYADEDYILGYGLLNEPFVPECSTADESLNLYYSLMEETASAIRTVDNNHMLFVERPYGTVNSKKNTTNYIWGTTESYRLISDANTVYEFHFYERTAFTHQLLNWLSYTDKWVYNTDTIPFLTGKRQLGNIEKASPNIIDISSSEWQYIESNPFTITNSIANHGFWILLFNNMGENANAYIDNIIIKEYDENGIYIRNLHSYDFNTQTNCIGWSWKSVSSGIYNYDKSNGVNNSGCGRFSNITASYLYQRDYGKLDLNFPIVPGHKYVVGADIRLENVSNDFSIQLGIQTATSDKVYSFDKDYLRFRIQSFLDFGEQNNVPLYLGEFGVSRYIMNDEYNGDEWVEDVFDLLNEYNLSYSYHDYHEEHFGLYINDSRKPRNEINKTLYNIFANKVK